MRLNAVGIFCSDIESSLAFYRMLGVPFGDYDPEVGHYDAELEGGFQLMLDTYAIAGMFIEDFSPPAGNDQMSLAVELDSPAKVDDAYAKITDAGYVGVRAPFDAFWGQRYATVADPDGNNVDVYASQ